MSSALPTWAPWWPPCCRWAPMTRPGELRPSCKLSIMIFQTNLYLSPPFLNKAPPLPWSLQNPHTQGNSLISSSFWPLVLYIFVINIFTKTHFQYVSDPQWLYHLNSEMWVRGATGTEVCYNGAGEGMEWFLPAGGLSFETSFTDTNSIYIVTKYWLWILPQKRWIKNIKD